MSFRAELNSRTEKLLLTQISKQWMVFWLSTWLLKIKIIPPEVWAFIASFCIGAGIYQKQVGIAPYSPPPREQKPDGP